MAKGIKQQFTPPGFEWLPGESPLKGFEPVQEEKKTLIKPLIPGAVGSAYSLPGFEVAPLADRLGPRLPNRSGPFFDERPDLVFRNPTLEELFELESAGKLYDPQSGRPFVTGPQWTEFIQSKARGRALDLVPSWQRTASGAATRYLSGSTIPGVSEASDLLFHGSDVSERAGELQDEGDSFLEASRKAWEETDMPSSRVHLAWTFDWDTYEFVKGEIPLWGDKTFGGVDIGTKGFMEEIIMDPLNVWGVGKGFSWGTKALFKGGGSLADGVFRPTVLVPTQGNMPANAGGKTLTIGGGAPEWAGSTFVAASEKNWLGIPTVKVNLTKTEKIHNWVANHTPLPLVQKDGLAQSLVKTRSEMGTVADNLSTSMSAELDVRARRAFTIEKNGTVKGLGWVDDTLPGDPTIADIAARLPRFWDHLTRDQQGFMTMLRERLAPIEVQARELGMDIKKRNDIVSESLTPASEGFYVPRGNALTDGVDQVSKKAPPKRKVGSRGGHKQPAVFDSMAEGIAKGYEYIPLKDSIKSYIQAEGKNQANQWFRNVVKTMRDEEGNLLGSTALMRLEKTAVYKDAVTTRNRIRSKTQTLRNQNVRVIERSKMSERAMREADREIAAQETRIARAGEEAVEAIGPAIKRVEAAELKIKESGGYVREDLSDARKLLQVTVSDGRGLVRTIRNNLNNLRTAKIRFRKIDRELEKMTGKLETILEEADQLARIVDGDIAQEMPTAAIGKKYDRLMRRARFIEDRIEKMAAQSELLDNRIQGMVDRGEFFSDADRLTQKNFKEANETIRAMNRLENVQTRLKTELRMLQREQARAVKLAEKAETRQVRSIQKSAETATRRAVQLDDRTANALKRAYESQAEVQRLQDRFMAIQDEFLHAKALASRIPTGEARIGLQGLDGYTFPEEFADVINKNLIGELPNTGRYSRAVNTVLGYANFFRSIRATGDDSAVGIHGILGAFANPKATVETFRQHWKAWGTDGERLLGKFIEDFNARAVGEGRLTSEDWARELMRIGGEHTEFFISGAGIIEKFPLIKQANRAFGFYGDKLRLEWADDLLQEQLRNGKTIAELRASGKLREIAEGVNTATGWSKNQFAGDLGSLLYFAPRFLAARLTNLGRTGAAMVTDPLGSVEAVPGVGRMMHKAIEGRGARDIPLDQRIARKSMLRFIGGAATLTYGINHFLGNETESNVLEKKMNDKGEEEWVYNTNFMRIRFKETDYSLFGTYDSLARMLVMTGSGHPLEGFRGMASGPVQMVWDQASGEDSFGRPTEVDWMPGESQTLARMGYMMEQHVPFSFEDVPELAKKGMEGDVTGPGFRLGAEFFGVKNSPLGYRDWVHEIANEFSEEGKKSPSAIGDDPGWDPENLSRGEGRAIRKDPRLAEYIDSMDIELVGEDLAFANLTENLLNAEKKLLEVINSGADNITLAKQIKRMKANRASTFDNFENNAYNKEFIEKRDKADIKHVADYWAHKYWSRDLQEEPRTGYRDWESYDTEGREILAQAAEVGGEDLVRYITETSSESQNNYRSQRFTDPRVEDAVNEYDADHKIIREYYSLPLAMVNDADEANPQEKYGEKFRRYLQMSPGEKEHIETLSKVSTVGLSGKELREVEYAQSLTSLLNTINRNKTGWRKAIGDKDGNFSHHWLVEAKMWKWGEVEPVNPVVIAMKDFLIGQSRAAGNIGYFSYKDIESLIQGISAYSENNPSLPITEVAAQYLSQQAQPVGAR